MALAEAPTPHFIASGGAANGNCPGTAAAPDARPGHLCIYEAQHVNASGAGFFDPVGSGAGGVVRSYGAGVFVTAAGAGALSSMGAWAVTAP